MKEEFVPYEQALALKELGFDEPCFGLYAPPSKTVFLHHYGLLSAKEQILAPLYQQAFRWFREKYKIDSYHIEPTNSMIGNSYGVLRLSTATFNGGFKTYEEAELECLKKLIEIVKKK